MSWHVRSGAATDTGRVREANEDAYLVAPPMYAVADGMGGHAGGEVASALALETLRTMHEGSTEADLSAGVREANLAVYERQDRDPDLAGMGTTLTAIIVDEAGVRVAHVGDSRAYLLRDSKLTQITTDHTLVRELVQEGQLTEEQAREHPQRSMLTRAIGIDAVVEIDEAMIQPLNGDRLMLCSDGLTGMLTDEQILDALRSREAQDSADALVAMANAAGGTDNTTVIVLDISDAPPAPAGIDPVTGERTTTHTFADDIVIHGRGGLFAGRSPGMVIGLAIAAVVVVVVVYFLATGG